MSYPSLEELSRLSALYHNGHVEAVKKHCAQQEALALRLNTLLERITPHAPQMRAKLQTIVKKLDAPTYVAISRLEESWFQETLSKAIVDLYMETKDKLGNVASPGAVALAMGRDNPGIEHLIAELDWAKTHGKASVATQNRRAG